MEGGFEYDQTIAELPPSVRDVTPQYGVDSAGRSPDARHPGSPPSGASLPSGSYRMQRAQILDRNGFGREMTAYNLFVPAGWQTQGQVVWQNKTTPCGPNAVHVDWATFSPDGSRVMHILPAETWMGNNLPMAGTQQDCPNVGMTNVRDYLQWYLQRNRPNARILEYRDRPDIIKDSLHLNDTQRIGNSETRSWIEAGEVLIAYEVGGVEVRETIAIPTFFIHNRMPDAMGGVMEILTISAMPGLASRAPAGELDFQLIETVRSSIKADPQWQAAMFEHQRKMNEINAKGSRDRHNINMETIRAVGEINSQIYENRTASSDRMHHQTIQAIRGVDTYADPTTHERFELPYTHENAWRLDDGTFILTNDANFEPYRDLGLDGRQMEISR